MEEEQETTQLESRALLSPIDVRKGSSRDFVQREESEKTGLQMVESLSTEWTDEKHNLYLNSIEASFVQYLHNQNYPLKHLRGWLSRRQEDHDPNPTQSNSSKQFSSDQYKVLQRGSWEKLNFEKTRTQADNGKESLLLLENQFIEHARPASTAKNLEAKGRDIRQHCNLTGAVIDFGGQKYRTAVFGLATSSKPLSPSYSAICRQESVGSNYADMLDQNFVEEDSERKPTSRKRPRVAAADVSSTDQVVPLGISPVTVSANGSYSRRKPNEHCNQRT